MKKVPKFPKTNCVGNTEKKPKIKNSPKLKKKTIKLEKQPEFKEIAII